MKNSTFSLWVLFAWLQKFSRVSIIVVCYGVLRSEPTFKKFYLACRMYSKFLSKVKLSKTGSQFNLMYKMTKEPTFQKYCPAGSRSSEFWCKV